MEEYLPDISIIDFLVLDLQTCKLWIVFNCSEDEGKEDGPEEKRQRIQEASLNLHFRDLSIRLALARLFPSQNIARETFFLLHASIKCL